MGEIDKVGLLVIVDGRMLLCRKKRGTGLLILPGGKREPGETSMETLLREVHEELGDVQLTGIQHIGDYSDRAAGDPGKMVRVELYRADLEGDPHPQSEIGELIWFGPKDDPAQLAPSIRNKILPDLIARRILSWR